LAEKLMILGALSKIPCFFPCSWELPEISTPLLRGGADDGFDSCNVADQQIR
jgi:hypothetical protein